MPLARAHTNEGWPLTRGDYCTKEGDYYVTRGDHWQGVTKEGDYYYLVVCNEGNIHTLSSNHASGAAKMYIARIINCCEEKETEGRNGREKRGQWVIWVRGRFDEEKVERVIRGWSALGQDRPAVGCR